MQYTTTPWVSEWVRLLFYQDFKDTFVCNTQHHYMLGLSWWSCFIRISKILLYAIHNIPLLFYHLLTLFYQDFKDTFVCNTQHADSAYAALQCCFIRISKILLYAIHNWVRQDGASSKVVLSGFQRYFCMQYTTLLRCLAHSRCCFIRISKILLYAIHNTSRVCWLRWWVVLSGFQWTILLQKY